VSAAVAAVGLAGAFAIAAGRRIGRWGASEEEVARPLPGDDEVPNPGITSTRAISIHAPTEVVWPWPVQMGWGREVTNYSSQDRNSTFDFADWGFRTRPRYQQPPSRQRVTKLRVKDLLAGDLLRPGALLRPARNSVSATAVVGTAGEIVLDGVAFRTPSGAAKAASGQRSEAGWDFWLVQGEGASLADLRLRLRALERARSPIAERFEASIGNGREGYYGVEGDGVRARWQFGRAVAVEVDELSPTPEEWVRFWDALDRARVWDWESRYETAGVCDGTYWHVTAERGGRRVESVGSNGYPNAAGADPGRTFSTFCRAVSRLSGHVFA
jgi:hypothetical protein